MAQIVLIHSILGLRPVERSIAARWEAAGHGVTLPDLYGGRSAESYEDGFTLWGELKESAQAMAREAILNAPQGAVLSGVSMGAGQVSASWGERPDISGAILFAGSADPAPGLPKGLPVQAHIARPDPFDDEGYFADWVASMGDYELDLYRYDGVGHYSLDPALEDFGAAEAELCLSRTLDFLAGL
ncbi:dienelactone hydrolase [Pseudoroseicyclus sp. CLL3-39]|uniref:Dienelactone hydrolase n=2 Tax=Pseudoroseicyclus tamaricis TaxID=2705421 RepID=A0A6B2JRU6_9RHOB|nr:dienelactone hydrolase [Pseudoroseicyclus tamaricis]